MFRNNMESSYQQLTFSRWRKYGKAMPLSFNTTTTTRSYRSLSFLVNAEMKFAFRSNHTTGALRNCPFVYVGVSNHQNYYV